MARSSTKRGKSAPRRRGGRPGAARIGEWVVGVLSALVVIAMIGFLLYEALNTGTGTPNLHVTVDRVVAAEGGFHVSVRALNAGDATVSDATFEARLVDGERTLEVARVKLNFVPARSQRRAGFVFQRDPRAHDLRIRAVSYVSP